MDATPEVNSKEFYRAQIRKKLDQQDAFLHRQAILTIEDMRRKGTYRGMTRDMTLEEKQVCLEIEMANLGIESEDDEPEFQTDNIPARTSPPESPKKGSCTSPINNSQSKSFSPNIIDSVRTSSKSTGKQDVPNSPRVNGVVENCPCPATADVPPPPFVPNAQKVTGDEKQKTSNVTRENNGSDGAIDSGYLMQTPRRSSCQGDVDSLKTKSQSSPKAGSISSKISNDSNRTFITSGPSKSDKSSGRKVKHRLTEPPTALSFSDEEMHKGYRIRQNANRRREHRKI